MGSIFKPTFTKPLPEGAEVFTRKGERFARWIDSKGRKRLAKVVVPSKGKYAGLTRILVQSTRYVARYRDARGVHVVPTECRDETAARGFLRNLERRAELVRGNLLTHPEVEASDHQATSLVDHIREYDEHLRVHVNRKTGFAASDKHRRLRRDHLNRVVKELGWTTLPDLKRPLLEKWLAAQAATGMGARTRNSYAVSWSAFANWLVDTGRLIANPFSRLANANEDADPRRQRRALSATDLVKLIDAAQRRPLAEYGRETMKLEPVEGKKRKRSNWTYKPVTPENICDCERRARLRLRKRPDLIADLQEEGRRRGLFYKTLVLTGLRLNELRSLTVGAATLSGANPFVVLAAADEKARRGAEILLRDDLAKDLTRDVVGRLGAQQRAAECEKRPIPMTPPVDTPLLVVPSDAVRCLDRDLVAAGLARSAWGKNREGACCWRINKRDERGRTFDLHAFRTTFNSLLAAASVSLTTRQILMRHAAQGVTDKHYRDVGLIDLRGALGQLPSLPLVYGGCEPEVLSATGTDNQAAVEAIAAAACTGACYATDENDALRDTADETSPLDRECETVVSGPACESCTLLSLAYQQRANGFEPSTFSLEG